MTKLRWKKGSTLSSFESALSGTIYVGHAGKVDSDRPATEAKYVYQITGISTKYITKGYGYVSSMASAKRAVQRAWDRWCKEAALIGTPFSGANDIRKKPYERQHHNR